MGSTLTWSLKDFGTHHTCQRTRTSILEIWVSRVKAYSNSCYLYDNGAREFNSIHYTYLGGNIVIWHNEKKNTISLTSVEAKHYAIATIACKKMWMCVIFPKNLNSLTSCMYVVL